MKEVLGNTDGLKNNIIESLLLQSTGKLISFWTGKEMC